MMNIQKLAYVISEDKFFNSNFDIDLGGSDDKELNIKTNRDMNLLLCDGIQISIKLLSFGNISVRFVDDYSSSMNLIYCTHIFDGERFVDWLKWSFRNFVNQYQVYNL